MPLILLKTPDDGESKAVTEKGCEAEVDQTKGCKKEEEADEETFCEDQGFGSAASRRRSRRSRSEFQKDSQERETQVRKKEAAGHARNKGVESIGRKHRLEV
jgi:hypothetical protein